MLGIFDSGIGGLTTVRELQRQAPSASFVYLGDTARMPYGNKTRETIVRYANEDADFLLEKSVDAIIIACNTASTVADEVRNAHPGVPVFDVITPAVDEALAVTRGRIGIIGTRTTINSGVYECLLKEKRSVRTISQACPLFVPLVEEGWLDEGETKRIVRHYLSSLRQQQIDTLILGCTHYPLLAPMIQRYLGNRVKLIDSGAAVVRRVRAELSLDNRAEQKFFLTDVSPQSEQIARNWLGRPVSFELARVP